MEPETGYDEAALAGAARAGDKQALKLLLTANFNWLKGLVCSVTCDRTDIDDILQQICVRVISKIAGLRRPDRFRAWLAVVARNEAQRYFRDRKTPLSLDDPHIRRRLPAEASRVRENVETKEQCERIMQAVKHLPEKYREAFMMAYSDDLTYTQIAEILDVPITTIQIRLVRARRMIYDQVVEKDTVI
jgi:RNA polymerase sigma-70 factor (ECF subfamily)